MFYLSFINMILDISSFSRNFNFFKLEKWKLKKKNTFLSLQWPGCCVLCVTERRSKLRLRMWQQGGHVRPRRVWASDPCSSESASCNEWRGKGGRKVWRQMVRRVDLGNKWLHFSSARSLETVLVPGEQTQILTLCPYFSDSAIIWPDISILLLWTIIKH